MIGFGVKVGSLSVLVGAFGVSFWLAFGSIGNQKLTFFIFGGASSQSIQLGGGTEKAIIHFGTDVVLAETDTTDGTESRCHEQLRRSRGAPITMQKSIRTDS